MASMTKAASDERSAIFDLCELPLCPKEEDEKGFFFFFPEIGTNIFTSSGAMPPLSTSQGV